MYEGWEICAARLGKGDSMERRAASHTEEEEMNQRRRLLNAAKKGDQKAVAKLFEKLETLSAPQLGAAVVQALTLVQGKPEHRPIAMQLEMVAMNLKNLK